MRNRARIATKLTPSEISASLDAVGKTGAPLKWPRSVFTDMRHFDPIKALGAIKRTLESNVLGEAALRIRRQWLPGTIPGHGTRILFSRWDDWEPAIRQGFQRTSYQLTFAPLTAEEVIRHDMVVPLSVPDLKWLDGVRALVADNPIPIPTLRSVQLCEDKLLFHQALVQAGFADFLPRVADDLDCPYLLKKRIDAWGEHTHIITDRSQEPRILAGQAEDDYLRQEMIRGDREYATHILFAGSRVVYSLDVEYQFDGDHSIKGKSPASSMRTRPCPFLGVFGAILKAIGFEGLCCVNYKTIAGRPRIFEINPRFGGSLAPHFCSVVEHLRQSGAQFRRS